MIAIKKDNRWISISGHKQKVSELPPELKAKFIAMELLEEDGVNESKGRKHKEPKSEVKKVVDIEESEECSTFNYVLREWIKCFGELLRDFCRWTNKSNR